MNSTDDEISISRAKLESITVYDVMEEELETIEAGSPSSLYLNFSIALLSVFVSLLTTLLVTPIGNDRVFMSFISACIITGVLGLLLLVLWYKSNKDSKTIFHRIRARKSADSIRVEAGIETIEASSESVGNSSTSPKG